MKKWKKFKALKVIYLPEIRILGALPPDVVDVATLRTIVLFSLKVVVSDAVEGQLRILKLKSRNDVEKENFLKKWKPSKCRILPAYSCRNVRQFSDQNPQYDSKSNE